MAASFALNSTKLTVAPAATFSFGSRLLGTKEYDLSDHLGNVTVQLSDRKTGTLVTGDVQAQVLSYQQYYPFGWGMLGRSLNADKARMDFQGQETDEEWLGGNAVAYKYRFHDPRLGRFQMVDPLAAKYPWNSPYAFSENRLIDGVELEGLEFTKYLDRNSVRERVLHLSENPEQINQGGAGTCTIAAVTYLWIKRNSNEFVNASMELYDKGSVEVNDYNINPDAHLFDVDPNDNEDIYWGTGSRYQADWMITSSIQDAQNWYIDFDGVSSDEMGAGNYLEDATELMEKLVGYKNVRWTKYQRGFVGLFKMSGSAIMESIITQDKKGGGIYLSIDAHILDPSYEEGSGHGVAYISGSYSSSVNSEGDIIHSFDVQTWGGTETIEGTNDDIKKYINGAVYGDDEE